MILVLCHYLLIIWSSSIQHKLPRFRFLRFYFSLYPFYLVYFCEYFSTTICTCLVCTPDELIPLNLLYFTQPFNNKAKLIQYRTVDGIMELVLTVNLGLQATLHVE